MKTLNSIAMQAKQNQRLRKTRRTVHAVETLEVRSMLAADVLANVGFSSTAPLGSAFTDVAGLSTTITLTEETVLRLDARLNMASSVNSSFNGEVRFAINGTGQATAATFENPYLLPSMFGTTSAASVTIDFPTFSTSTSGAGGTHNHQVNIPSFTTNPHTHSVSVSPVSSGRTWGVSASDWVTLAAGTYTISVQAMADNSVSLDDLQKFTVTKLSSEPVPEVQFDEIMTATTESVTSEFVDVPGLTSTITLTEETVISLESQLGMTSVVNGSFVGEVRFAVDGSGLGTAATFDNPYILPGYSGTTNGASVSINPPSTTTSSAGSPSHNHQLDIPTIGSSVHVHTVSLSAPASTRNWNVEASDWVTLGPGTYTFTVQARATTVVSLDGFQKLVVAQFSPDAVTASDYIEVDSTTGANVAATFADVPGLTSTFTLDQASVVYLDSQLSMTSTVNGSFTGRVRFAVDGVGGSSATGFQNPFVAPPMSGSTSFATFTVDPPSTTTSTSGAAGGHSHVVNISPFTSSSHNHFVTVSPSTLTARSWNVDASDWIALGPGTYTITVQAFADSDVSFDGAQSLNILSVPANAPPVASIDTVSEVRVEGNIVVVDASATDANEDAQLLNYQYRVYVNGSGTPAFQNTGIDLTQFVFTPAVAGSYRIELTVTDSVGASDVVEEIITVLTASQLELVFSDDDAAVGDLGPSQTATFHEWQDATAQLWITIHNDLPDEPFDLKFVVSAGDRWFDNFTLESTLTTNSTWNAFEVDGDRVVSATLQALDLSGYQVGQQVLLATILFPPDVSDSEGIAIQSQGAYETTTTDHAVRLENAEVDATGQKFAVAGDATGEFAPVIYDADDSGHVGIGDFALFIGQYGKVPSVVNPNAYLFDFDRSGKVGISDFAAFIRYYGLRKPSGERVINMPHLTSNPPASPSLEGEPLSGEEIDLIALPIAPEDYLPELLTGQFSRPETATAGPVSESEIAVELPGPSPSIDPRLIDTALACEIEPAAIEEEESDEWDTFFESL